MAALCNVRILWPRCARFLFNTYRGFSPLIIQGTNTILYSQEGVTQGDPLSMLLYGVATIPLIDNLNSHREVVQNWYADDASAVGDLDHVKSWFMELMRKGPAFGYFPEPRKSYLIVSTSFKERAQKTFGSLGVQVVTGQRFLGGYIGDKEGKEQYLTKKIADWCWHVEKLAKLAEKQPQNAFAALTKSLQFQWSYFQHVIPDCSDLFRPLEQIIAERFLPSVIGGPITAEERSLFSLPARKGGLGVRCPTLSSDLAYQHSKASSNVIRETIVNRGQFNGMEHRQQLDSATKATHKEQDKRDDDLFNEIITSFSPAQQRALKNISKEKASGWLTVLPLAKHHFDLSEAEFRDGLSMRYRRALLKSPAYCDGCGAVFNLTHALDCKKGGLVTLRHNEIRDALGDLSALVWSNVRKEPIIREANDVENAPALIADLGVRGVWQPQCDALFDICVVDTDAPSYLSRTIPSILKNAEGQKKQKYHAACDIRRASFTPIVVTTDGIFGMEAKIFIKRLSERLSHKWNKSYSEISYWLRVRLSFAVLRASEFCVRGSRQKWRCIGIGDDGASLPFMY